MENEFRIREWLLAEAQGEEYTQDNQNRTGPGEDNIQARGNSQSTRENSNGYGSTIKTGWESKRESFKINYQSNNKGRNTVCSATNTHSPANVIGASIVCLGRLTGIIEGNDESEEERKRREAQNAGTGIGLAVGVIAEVILSADIDDGEDEAPTMKM